LKLVRAVPGPEASVVRKSRSAPPLPHRPDHIVRRHWPSDPVQLELAERLDPHGVLDLRQHAGADQYLPRLGFSQTGRVRRVFAKSRLKPPRPPEWALVWGYLSFSPKQRWRLTGLNRPQTRNTLPQIKRFYWEEQQP
jgi:hypothetical protein